MAVSCASFWLSGLCVMKMYSPFWLSIEAQEWVMVTGVDQTNAQICMYCMTGIIQQHVLSTVLGQGAFQRLIVWYNTEAQLAEQRLAASSKKKEVVCLSRQHQQPQGCLAV